MLLLWFLNIVCGELKLARPRASFERVHGPLYSESVRLFASESLIVPLILFLLWNATNRIQRGYLIP